jgi:hypothetical protein
MTNRRGCGGESKWTPLSYQNPICAKRPQIFVLRAGGEHRDGDSRSAIQMDRGEDIYFYLCFTSPSRSPHGGAGVSGWTLQMEPGPEYQFQLCWNWWRSSPGSGRSAPWSPLRQKNTYMPVGIKC